MRGQRFLQVCLSLLVIGLSNSGSAALIITLTSTGNASADAGFQRAADYITSKFTDNATVNITSGFAQLNPGVLGSAGSVRSTYGFGAWKTALAADITSADDATFSSSLPGGSSFSAYINRTSDNPNGSGSATPYVDNDGGANNSIVRLSNANAKALGLIDPHQVGSDANITFSNQFIWDFDPSDGITAGAIDFVGVAIHELMHAMGFFSGVDTLDFNGGAGPNANLGPFNDDQFTYVNGLDFTRVSAASLSAGADIDWTANNVAKNYSIDGGATILASNAWSLGVYNGDGRQASHWKDNLGWGIMDPTSAPAGQANVVTAMDLQALDIIGWSAASSTSVPEPSSLALMSIGLIGIAGVRRCRAAKRSA